MAGCRMCDLSWNIVNGTIPWQIGAMSSLVHLDLRGNRLSSTLPTSLANLTALQYLDASTQRDENGGLYTAGLTGTLPSELSGMSALTYVHQLAADVFD